MFRGFLPVAYKEFLQIRRDSFSLFLVLVIPVFQLLLFGYAINTTVENIKTAVYNLDGRKQSLDLLDEFKNTRYFKIAFQAFSDQELNRMLVTGKAKIGIKIPPDYSDRVLRGQQASVLVLIDGSDSTVASQAVTVAGAVALKDSLEQLAKRQIPPNAAMPLEVRPKMLFNPDSRTANFMVPGLIAIIMQNITIFLTTLSLVKEREDGTLEQLLVTPVRPMGLMLGKLVPYGLISFVETMSVVLAMRYIFSVPINGSVLLLVAFSLIFLFLSLGVGLLISSKAQNQIQAVYLTFFIFLPSILLSGFMFPRESMPTIMWLLGYFIPVTYFIDIMRGIVLRGAGFFELWQDAAILAAMGVLVFSFSVFRFRKKLA